MPQHATEVEREHIVCQECLEREAGNWFDEATPELIKLVNSSFEGMENYGTCMICGKMSAQAQLPSGTYFDCLGEDLEIEISQDWPPERLISFN